MCSSHQPTEGADSIPQGDRVRFAPVGPCDYTFVGTNNRCGAAPCHPVHKRGSGQGGSQWPGPEEYHRYQTTHDHVWVCRCGAMWEEPPA